MALRALDVTCSWLAEQLGPPSVSGDACAGMSTEIGRQLVGR